LSNAILSTTRDLIKAQMRPRSELSAANSFETIQNAAVLWNSEMLSNKPQLSLLIRTGPTKDAG
jgi:hypothetical protein